MLKDITRKLDWRRYVQRAYVLFTHILRIPADDNMAYQCNMI